MELDIPRRWAVRCLLSYWRYAATHPGPSAERELDGLNEVEYDSTGRRWRTLQDTQADLEAMPNRSAIPLRFEVGGRIDYEFGPDKQVLKGAGTKRISAYLGSRRVNESTLTVDWNQAPASTQWQAEYSQHYPFIEPSHAAENERALQSRTLAGATLEQVLAKAARPRMTVRQRNEVFLQLRALFYLHPEEAARALQLLKPPVVDLVAESLAGTGNELAQAALAKLLEREVGTDAYATHLGLLIPLVRMEPSCRAALLRAAFESADLDLRYTAQLIVGSNVRRCLDVNPEQAKAFGDRLAEALETADEDGKLNLLYALGNAADADRLPIQERFLADPSPRLRAGAVHSLRHLIDERLRTRLSELAKTDPDPGVRKEIEDVLAGAAGSN